MMIDHIWTTRRAESKTSNPERLPFLGNFSSGSFGFGENATYSKSWRIATNAKTLKARVSYFSKTEGVNLPCKLTFGLGPEP